MSPPIGNNDMRMRNLLFKACFKQLKNIFGDSFISGDCLYTMKKINELKFLKCAIYSKGKVVYNIIVDKWINKRSIRQEDIQKDPLLKQYIEIIIKDILLSNPKLEDYNGFFVLKDQKKEFYSNEISIKLYPGFTTSLVETDSGNYLNVTLKNKVILNETIYDYLTKFEYKNKTDKKNEIKENLIGRSFKVCFAKRNYQIDDILFDRTPKNSNINYEGKTIDLINYYYLAHQLKIKDGNQPPILVRKTDC